MLTRYLLRPTLALRFHSLLCTLQTLCAEVMYLPWRTKTLEVVLGMVGILLSGLLVTMAAGQESVTRRAEVNQLEQSQAGTWQPWVLTSASQLRPLPPPEASATK